MPTPPRFERLIQPSRGALAATAVVTSAILLGASACRRSEASATKPAASVNPATSVMAERAGSPLPPALIASTLNPTGLPVYEGPFGSVVGKITVKGDEPPAQPPPHPTEAKCGKDAAAFYARLFRVGPAGELADAIVGATGYSAFVPPTSDTVQVTIKGCAFDRRSVVATFGQRIDVKNNDVRDPYLPHLDGAKAPALMVAVPRGQPVHLYPPKPGVYRLIDDLQHPWMQAGVFVFKYPTAAVSDSAGLYRIDRVPTGKVKVSVRHPEIEQTLEREVEIAADKTTEVNFELTYHR